MKILFTTINLQLSVSPGRSQQVSPAHLGEGRGLRGVSAGLLDKCPLRAPSTVSDEGWCHPEMTRVCSPTGIPDTLLQRLTRPTFSERLRFGGGTFLTKHLRC